MKVRRALDDSARNPKFIERLVDALRLHLSAQIQHQQQAETIPLLTREA